MSYIVKPNVFARQISKRRNYSATLAKVCDLRSPEPSQGLSSLSSNEAILKELVVAHKVIGIDEGEVDIFLTALREHLALLVLKDNGKLIGWMKVVRAYPQRWRKKCPLPV